MTSCRHDCRASLGRRSHAAVAPLLPRPRRPRTLGAARRCLLLVLGLLGASAPAPSTWCGPPGRPAASGRRHGARGVSAAAAAGAASEAPAAAGPPPQGQDKQAEEEEEEEAEPEFARSNSLGRRLRDRLAEDIAEQKAAVGTVPTEEQKQIQRETVDLNGIDPIACLAGAVPTAALSYGFWTFTGSAAEWFVEHPIETEFYPAQRLGIAFQTALVGLSSLAAGIFGFTALGIFLLGVRVALGVASGELDPAKESDEPRRQTTAEKVRDIFTKDPVDVVMAQRRAKGQGPPGGGAGGL